MLRSEARHERPLITQDDGKTPAVGGEDEIWVFPTFTSDADAQNVQWALDNVAEGGTVRLKAPRNPDYDPQVPYDALDIRCHPRIPFYFGRFDQVWAWQAGTLTGERPIRVGAPESDAGTWYTTIVGGSDAVSTYNAWDDDSTIQISNIHFTHYGHHMVWGAIWLQDSHDVTISDCRFDDPRNIGDYAIGFENTLGADAARGGTITFDHNVIKQFTPPDVFSDTIMFAFLGRYVMSDLEITNNYIEATDSGLFNHEANPDGVARDLVIRNNTIHLISGSFTIDGGAFASGDSFENRTIEDNRIFVYPSRSGTAEISAAISVSNPDGFDNDSLVGTIRGNTIDLSARLEDHFPDLPRGIHSPLAVGSTDGAIRLWQGHREFSWSPLVAPVHNLEITDNTILGSGAYGISIPEVQGPIPNAATRNTIANNDLSGFTVERFNPDYDLYCDSSSADTTDPPMLVRSRGGPFGGALSFDGRDRITVEDPGADSALDITDAITIAAWVECRTDEYTNLWGARFLVKPHEAFSAPNFKYDLGIDGQFSGNWGAVLFGLDLGEGRVGLTGTRSICDETWHHVVGSWDGQWMRIYVDGVVDAKRLASGRIGTNDEPVYLGQTRFGDGNVWNHFTGSLDDVALWSRALGADEVRALAGIHNRNRPVTPLHPDELATSGALVLYFPADDLADEGRLQVLPDWSDGEGDGPNPGYANAHFCADPPARTLDGTSHIWVGASASDNGISGNLIGPVGKGVAGIVCDGRGNDIGPNDYRESGIPGWTSEAGVGSLQLGQQSRSNTVVETLFPIIGGVQTTLCDQVLDLSADEEGRPLNLIDGYDACLDEGSP